MIVFLICRGLKLVCNFRSESSLQLTMSSVCSFVCTLLAVLYLAIVYIVYNDSLSSHHRIFYFFILYFHNTKKK